LSARVMSITIRRMVLEDLPGVIQIDRTSFSLPWPEQTYRYEISANRAARCLVAETEDKKIAAMIVSWIVVDELHIATFATHLDYRRQGIGSHLLAKALKDGRAMGMRRAFLEVRAGNQEAQALYRKFGFEVTGIRPKYYRDNDEDAVLMTLEPLEPE
jgi:ribosomal-protein-alanine N-acetyltransferase